MLGIDWDVLAAGLWSHSDPNGSAFAPSSPQGLRAGQPLAELDGETFSGVFIFMTGDLEMFANELSLVSFNANDPCPFCLCNRSSMPWTDFSWRAKWRKRICTEAEFRLASVAHSTGFGGGLAFADGPSCLTDLRSLEIYSNLQFGIAIDKLRPNPSASGQRPFHVCGFEAAEPWPES